MLKEGSSIEDVNSSVAPKPKKATKAKQVKKITTKKAVKKVAKGKVQ